MAGKAAKRHAQTNWAVLKKLYMATVPVVVLALLRTAFNGVGFPLVKLICFHLPLVGCLYMIDKNGRPVYGEVDGKQRPRVVKEGIDLSQDGGIVGYMFDVVYLSLFADFGNILFNSYKLWYLVLMMIPVYLGYKLWGFKDQFTGLLPRSAPVATNPEETPVKSKRQLKREKRSDNVKYKYR